jgi:predicted GNAT family N-acyltransferase
MELPRKRWDEIRIVSSAVELEKIYRFRYQIYVEEMHRHQKYADHDNKRIEDELDTHAINIAAFAGDTVVGVVRANVARRSSLGAYEAFYDLRGVGDEHPDHTGTVTRLMIAPHLRHTTLAVRLCIKCYTLGLENDVRWCFIDCNDHMVRFFEGLGFKPYMGKVMHEEYGHVTPMRLKLHDEKHLEAVKSPFLASFKAWRAGKAVAERAALAIGE